MRKPPGGRRHKQSLPPFVTFPSLEEEIRKFRCIDYENDQNHTIIALFQHERTNVFYSICYFDPNSFCAFHYYVKGATPSLSSPDGTSLIFYHSEFWTTCDRPEKQSCPEIFHCVEIFFISQDLQLSLALKTECALKIFTLFNILFTFRIFEQLALALKNSVSWIHCNEYIFFIIQNFEQLALAWKTEFALKFFTVLNLYFLLFKILQNLRLPWKTEFALKIFTVFNLFFTFRIFEQLAFALKNRLCPEFTVLNIYFYHSKFWTTWACPENQSLPRIFQSGGLPTPASYATAWNSADPGLPHRNKQGSKTHSALEQHRSQLRK